MWLRDAVRKNKEKSFGHLSKRWEGVALKNILIIEFNLGQEHREGGGQVILSKIKKCLEHGKSFILSVFLADIILIKQLYSGIEAYKNREI